MTIEFPPSLNMITPRALLQGSGNADALENVNPTPLPDGALCWVINQQEIYYLDKTSVTAVSAPSVIATCLGAGVPGRWIQNATSGPPTGAAGGNLSGTYPNPAVSGFTEAGGPTSLSYSAVADQGQLFRNGIFIRAVAPVRSVTSPSFDGLTGTRTPLTLAAAIPADPTSMWAVWWSGTLIYNDVTEIRTLVDASIIHANVAVGAAPTTLTGVFTDFITVPGTGAAQSLSIVEVIGGGSTVNHWNNLTLVAFRLY
jgi:hypothetical protein